MLNALEQKILSLIDLTSLNDDDSDQTILELCKKAITPQGAVAAVCVYPQFVKLVRNFFSSKKINIATVVNFPHGNDPLDKTIALIKTAIDDGANEIDVVFPYQQYLSGDVQAAVNFIRECKNVCGKNILLKVILETGALKEPEIIFNASQAILNAGADFLKTSTGKIAVGATPEAVTAMFKAIKMFNPNAGIKVSGGVRTIQQAENYLSLVSQEMGDIWATPSHFRIGASALLDEILLKSSANYS